MTLMVLVCMKLVQYGFWNRNFGGWEFETSKKTGPEEPFL
jgi:hypothetical protein